MADKAGSPSTAITIPLNGRLITALQGSEIGQGNFQVQKNMRPSPTVPKGTAGMTKITTNQIDATYYKVRASHHYTKTKPAESHILVQAFNSDENAARILDNTTAIPSQGNFSGTALYTPAAVQGGFSDTPDGCVAFCDGTNSLIYGGNEYRCGGFQVLDPNGNTFKYDYTQRVQNTLTDAANVASMKSVPAAVDSSTKALWHLDNAVTDSGAGGHDLTNVSNKVTFTTTNAPYGTHWAVFNGTDAYFTAADHADFDFSGGVFTIDATINLDASGARPIYYHYTTNVDNSFLLTASATSGLALTIKSGGSTVLSFTGSATLTTNTTFKIRLVENGDDYYFFVNGALIATTSSAVRAANYTSTVRIGEYNGVSVFSGKMDEIRISNIARSTSDYVVDTYAFGSQAECHAYLLTTRPIRGWKAYVGTANTTTVSSVRGYYWSGGAFTTVGTITDGTLTGSAPNTIALGQTGSISFTSTVGLAKPKMIDGIMAYVYYFVWTGLNTVTPPTIYNITIDAPMQPVVDLWGGEYSPILAAWVITGTTTLTYKDYASNILNLDGMTFLTSFGTISYMPHTYMSITSLATTSKIVFGSQVPLCGIYIDMLKDVPGSGTWTNTNNAIMTVKRWDGTQFTAVSNLIDGTLNDSKTKSLGHSGLVTWSPADTDQEFPTAISNDQQLYYYQFTFSGAISASTGIDRAQGVPCPKTINGHKFPYTWNSRLLLCNESSGDENSILIAAFKSDCVFNGTDSTRLYFGKKEPIVACGKLFNRDNNGIYESLVVCTLTSTYVVEGSSPKDFHIKAIAEQYGCVSAKTMTICDTGIELGEGVNKHVLIWLSTSGWVVFDNSTIRSIDDDIGNYFNELKTEYVNRSYIDKSVAFFDANKREIHCMIPSGSATSVSTEHVLDIATKKWYVADRGTGKQLTSGLSVRDTKGNFYAYGFTDAGYMYRLNYGVTMDGNSLVYTLRTADMTAPDMMHEELIRVVRAIFVNKTSGGSVTIKYYANTLSAGVTLGTVSLVDGTHSWAEDVIQVNNGAATTHSYELIYTNGAESAGFEPVSLGAFIQPIREVRRGDQCQ